MIGLLKAFGKGILYVIGAPFFVAALILFGAIGLLAFIFQIFKSIIFFFTGQKFFPELPEDKELRLKREAASRKEEPVQDNTSADFSNIIFEEEIPVPEEKPAPVFLERTEPEPTIEETVFNDTSSLEDLIEEKEELSEKPIKEEEPVEEEHTVLETSNEPVEEEEEYEELETYVPRSSTYSDANEDEDNNTDSGVDIKYDL